ncbi:DNA-3-methyladenine glycosylase [uncultured Cellulomonas sp.]|uniref:DNA-3-methyladenine glycosylase n=1 Tax=uncultured Cellulomonas sp. TaxID=189682 RepID=UPI0026123D1B|nr:DNA-3-methyladenine glycosylase [uncultured Cellulomonas sp.]
MTAATRPDHVPSRDWYQRDAHDVGADLLGAHVTTRRPDGEVTVRLTEVEVYRGQADPASHAYRGPTARNAAMFGEPGRLYVYRHLGLHHCVNVVTGPEGVASAVLLRAGEVVAGIDVAGGRRRRAGVLRSDVDLARGPARLAVALGLDLTALRADLTDPAGDVVVQRHPAVPALPHVTGPRVGVSGEGADAGRYPWRLWLPDEPTVSVYRPAAPRRRPAARKA